MNLATILTAGQGVARINLIALLLLVGCEAGDEGRTESMPVRVRVLAYNIHHGVGLDGRLDLDRIARLIADVKPDLVALQEVDQGAGRTNGVDQAGVLGQLTGLTPLFGPFMEFDGGAYGMALLSRWEIMYSRNVRLPDGCVACSCNPFPCVEGRTSMVAAIRSEQTGRKIVFAGVHFYQNDEERLAQAKALAAELDSQSGPVILAGDFNSERGSPVMEEFRSNWRILDKQSAPQTIPAFAPDREIDFILVREDSNVEVVSHFVLGESVASDHRPIVADLVFPPLSR